MKRPELITFDCYGTLIDWNKGISGAFRAEAERQGLEASDRQILAAYHAAEPVYQVQPPRPKFGESGPSTLPGVTYGSQ